MKFILLYSCFCVLTFYIDCKSVSNPTEIKDREEFLEDKFEQFLQAWKEDTKGRPFTAKQQAWWDSLGVRHPQSENKQNVKLRREVRQLTETEWQTYTNAVNALNNLYPDPQDNRTQYQLFTEAHRFPQAPAAHGGAAFLVWHREYLWRMERALQMENPDIALSYWDTTLDLFLPDPRDSVMFSEYLFGNNDGHVTTGPFAWFSALESCLERYEGEYTHLFRRESTGSGHAVKLLLLNNGDIESVLEKTAYGNVSTSPFEFEAAHGAPHGFVGGLMGNPSCSPSDPIFFSYHTFIDWIFQEFRDHSQETPLETEYPEDRIGGSAHAAYADMNPFPGLYNIHGLSTHYTDYYFNYAPRHYTSCQTSDDCTSQYLWCDITNERCVSKIHAGGNCTGLDDESCYGETFKCVDGLCAELNLE